MTSPQARDLTWKINEFNQKVPGVSHAVVVSSDGLLLVASQHLPADHADQLAAAVSGLASVTNGMATLFGEQGVRQTVVEMGSGSLLVRMIRDGSILAALVQDSADIGTVGYEMARLGKQAGGLLTPALRQELRPHVVDLGAAPPPPQGHPRREATDG